MGLLNNGLQPIAKEQRQTVSDDSFAPLFQAMYAQYSAEDPLSRQSRWAAERQREAYLDNKNEWDRIKQSGGELPNIDKPFSADPEEQQYLDKKWNEKWSSPFQIEGENGTSSTFNLRPLKTYGATEQPQMTPDYYNQVKNAYQQYGPDILRYIFS